MRLLVSAPIVLEHCSYKRLSLTHPATVTTMSLTGLQTYIHSSSEKGLLSVTTLIVGKNSAALVDPPFLIPDAKSVVSWIKGITSVPLQAIFVTHHHPDHYFSANTILDEYPACRLLAAPYVRAGIDREYDDKVHYWPAVFGAENVHASPSRPEPYPYSFFILDGHQSSPVILLGPVQGDSVDHTLFWLPVESTIICGDTIYARSTHLWVEEIETPQILSAWRHVLDLIESLKPKKMIPGHLEAGWTLDAAADLAHNRKYLNLFSSKITHASEKPKVDDLYQTFEAAFPQADRNRDFFLGHLADHYGVDGGKRENLHKQHNVGERTEEMLEGFVLHSK